MHYIQKHQAIDNRLPGLLLQMALYQCCETTKVHFMVLGRINRTAWGTNLLLTAVWASLVDCISSCHLLPCELYQLMSLTEGTALLFESEWVLYPTFSSPSAPTAHLNPLPPIHPIPLLPTYPL